MGGVEPAGDADDHFRDSRRAQALGETLHLDVVGLEAPIVPRRGIARHVGKPLDRSVQRDAPRRNLELQRDMPDLTHAVAVFARAVVETGHPHALLDETIQVDVGDDQLFVGGKAARFGEQIVVLENHGVAVPREIRRRFSRTRRGVQIGGHASAGLRRAQAPPIFGLANRDVARREIQQDGRAGERGICARRDWRPEILANLHGDCEARDVGHVVHEIVAERHTLTEQRDLAQDGVGACGELPLLVELAVIRQVCLGCDAEDTPTVDRDRTVEQFPVETQRRAHDEDGAEIAARRNDFADGRHGRLEQRVLMKQIFV